MNQTKLSSLEAISLVLTITIAHTVLSLPRILLNSTKSATLLNLLYVTGIVILLAWLIYYCFKKFPGQDILDVSHFLGGNILKNIVGSLFILYFVVSSSILLRNFSQSIQVIYFPMTNVTFVILFFIIAMTIVNYLSFHSSFKATSFIMPLAIISVLFLFLANIDNFSFSRMFPIFGDGIIDTFVTGIGNISAFCGISVLYFLPPLLKKPENYKKICIASIIISAIYLFLCVATLLFMFEFFISNDELMPLYSATRYIEFGSFVQRLESVFLLVWMIVFVCYLGIASKISILCFKKITKIKYHKPLVLPFSLLMFAIALLPKNYAESIFFENTIFRYCVWFFIFAFCIGILLIANWKMRTSKKEEIS